LSSLDEQVRGRLYEFVSACTEPVGRDEAAAAVGIGRPLAAYHLDKLVASGLLTASYRRPPGRGGPGAGRPAKVYTRSAREFMVAVPPREYELAARLLVRAVAADSHGRSRAALHDAARRLGAELGSRGRPIGARGESPLWALEAALSEHGFEPWHDEAGTVRLGNCPFRKLVELQADVVCGMNLALIEGLVAGLRADGLNAVLDPQPGHCCVAISTGKPRHARSAHKNGATG
jgi:predicted ArsR family transcriptional regulator